MHVFPPLQRYLIPFGQSVGMFVNLSISPRSNAIRVRLVSQSVGTRHFCLSICLSKQSIPDTEPYLLFKVRFEIGVLSMKLMKLADNNFICIKVTKDPGISMVCS